MLCCAVPQPPACCVVAKNPSCLSERCCTKDSLGDGCADKLPPFSVETNSPREQQGTGIVIQSVFEGPLRQQKLASSPTKQLWVEDEAEEAAAKVRLEEAVKKRMEEVEELQRKVTEVEEEVRRKHVAAASSPPRREKENKDDSTQRFDMEVKIISARGLRDQEVWDEVSQLSGSFIGGVRKVSTGEAPPSQKLNPFCVCELRGERKVKFRTRALDDTDTPSWNQVAKVRVSDGDILKFMVNTQASSESVELLGWAEMTFEQLLSGYFGELRLQDASDSPKAAREAYLKVRIKVNTSNILEDEASVNKPRRICSSPEK